MLMYPLPVVMFFSVNSPVYVLPAFRMIVSPSWSVLPPTSAPFRTALNAGPSTGVNVVSSVRDSRDSQRNLEPGVMWFLQWSITTGSKQSRERRGIFGHLEGPLQFYHRIIIIQ